MDRPAAVPGHPRCPEAAPGAERRSRLCHRRHPVKFACPRAETPLVETGLARACLVAVSGAFVVSACAGAPSATPSASSVDVVAAASSIALPGNGQPCGALVTVGEGRCSQADITAEEAVRDVAAQLRHLGLDPTEPKCEKAAATTPSTCSVSVKASPHALVFVALPHLLTVPVSPPKFHGIDAVLTTQ